MRTTTKQLDSNLSTLNSYLAENGSELRYSLDHSNGGWRLMRYGGGYEMSIRCGATEMYYIMDAMIKLLSSLNYKQR
jgi:hypothetical protein